MNHHFRRKRLRFWRFSKRFYRFAFSFTCCNLAISKTLAIGVSSKRQGRVRKKTFCFFVENAWQIRKIRYNIIVVFRSATSSILTQLKRLYGPMVKRLRHRPFTAVTGVRFPLGSPKKQPQTIQKSFGVVLLLFANDPGFCLVLLALNCFFQYLPTILSSLMPYTESLCA